VVDRPKYTNITFATRPLQIADTSLSSILQPLQRGAGIAANWLGSLTDGKLLIDGGVYIGAEFVCAFE